MNTIILSRPGTRVGVHLQRAAASLLAGWRYRRQMAATRRYLADMDEHMLQDLGVSRAQAAFDLEHVVRKR